MRSSKFLAAAIAVAATLSAHAQTPDYKNIGRAPTKEEIQAWDISIGPDGKGLPAGSGTAKQGAAIFTVKCIVCHGVNAEGKIGPALSATAADHETLKTLKPVKSVGAYWPYATMVWDYVNRAMPRNQSGTLKPDEVYALAAFVLFKSNIIQETDVMDATTLPKVQMPNRNGFIPARYSDIPDERKRGCTEGVCP